MRPARHDPLLAGLNPAAAAFEFAVVWLTLAGFALSDPEVTVSVGVATHRGGGTTPEKLVAIADRAAYRAKFSGRNSVAGRAKGTPWTRPSVSFSTPHTSGDSRFSNTLLGPINL